MAVHQHAYLARNGGSPALEEEESLLAGRALREELSPGRHRGDYEGRQHAKDRRSSLNRPRIGLFLAFLVACWFSFLALPAILLSLSPQEESTGPSVETEQHDVQRRPDTDYILTPDWDFVAPKQVRSFDWTITDQEGNPDGVMKPMMMINGKYFGPLIEVNEGDIIEVNVFNQATNATAIHWHGIFQNGSNWMDGAVGITQCPVAPDRSYQYRFNVSGQAGTYFYHGHQGVQALDGLVGPLVVHGRDDDESQPLAYASDRVVMLQDWYYEPASKLMREVLSPGVEDAPIPNTALINGRNRAICSDHPNRQCSQLEEHELLDWSLAKDGNHRFRFINVGGFGWFQVAIDEHDPLHVIEVDGTSVEPAPVKDLVIAPGQRYSAILSTDHTEKSLFWLRARMVTACFADQKLPENGVDEAKAVIRYTDPYNSPRHADHGEESISLPETTSELEFIPVCRDLTSSEVFSPSPSQPAPASADHSWYLRVNLAIGDWALQRGVLNSSSFRPAIGSPTLHRVLDGLASSNASFAVTGVNDLAFDAHSELTVSHSGVETVDLVLQNMDENAHPFHLHGAQVWVLGAGHGYFPGYEALGLQPEGRGLLNAADDAVLRNPLRRDTVTAEGFGWTLLRFVADNPGAWLFHCHVLWHSEAGMAMQFLSRLDVLKDWTPPEDAVRLCDDPLGELRKGATPPDEDFARFKDGG
ncbi:multicopper oxidase [Xylariomycetidae sp. FL0641]|nr:multicopper oxidase [Xylariomycetidae sp. FL0641]